MGLFDMFGAGGGSLSVTPRAVHVMPGTALGGTVSFTGGKRPQQIKQIVGRVVSSTVVTEKGPNGPQQNTRTANVVPDTVLSGPVSVQPGQKLDFAFEFAIPVGLQPTQQGHVTYRLSVSADIDGEVDPGAGTEITVGGAPGMAAGMDHGKGFGMEGSKGTPGMGMPGGQMGAMGMPGAQMAAPLAVGSSVMGQWQDGNWYAARVVAMQNGMFGVDWENPQLGASTWVQAQQVQQQQQPMGMPGMGMGMAPPVPMPLTVGSRCMAQWQDGNWYPGQVVAMQNGMFGVDWENPQLGASTWVQAHQIQGS